MTLSGVFDQDGIFNAEDKKTFSDWLAKNANKRMNVSIVRWRKKRSIPQNDYMHFIFTLIADELGYAMADIKGHYKIKFGIKHTSELDTMQMENFLERVRIDAITEHQIKCPLPNEAPLS